MAFAVVNFLFFTINITSSFLCPEQLVGQRIVVARVVLNELLFVLLGGVLCFCVLKVSLHHIKNPFNPKLVMQILPTIQEEND